MSSEDSLPRHPGAASSDSLLAFADALLAKTPGDPGRKGVEVRQYVTFFLRDYEIGLPILQCREILRPSAITRVPEAPEHVRGIVNLRGRIVPAVDTRACLGFEPAPLTARSRLLVVEVTARQFALVVDRISRIVKLVTSEIDPATAGTAVPRTVGVAQLGGAAIFVTDAERILHGGIVSPSSTGKGEPA
jgi:purine-binding chemotaxis protein CheW